MKAAEEGHVDIVKMLIEAGADVNVADKNGETALIKVAKNKNEDFLGLRNSVFSGNANEMDISRRISKMLSVSEIYEEIIILLLSAGADVNATDAEGKTILIWEAFKTNNVRVNLLLDAHADVNRKDKNNRTALMWAVYVDRAGSKFVAEKLIEAGADVNVAGMDGKTALMIAAENEMDTIVQLLKDAGAVE